MTDEVGADPSELVRACVHAGIHYVDLAEAPQFLDAVRRAAEAAGAAERGVLVVPGASTVPGLVQLLAQGWAKRDDVAEVRAWLSLGSRNPVGEGLLAGPWADCNGHAVIADQPIRNFGEALRHPALRRAEVGAWADDNHGSVVVRQPLLDLFGFA